MPKNNSTLNLPGFTVHKVLGKNPVFIHVNYRRIPRCTYCQSKNLRTKDTFSRKLRHPSYGLQRSYLILKAHKFQCRNCLRYFNQQFPGIAKHQRSTEKLKQQVFHYHTKGVSQKDLARDLRLGKSTVERWYHHYYKKEYKTLVKIRCPRVIGIDEHTFSKKQKMLTTFCDLERNKVFDIAKGRSQKDLHDFLMQLPGRHHVQVACIDLSTSYRALITKYFPNADIVADRFHVVRLANHACLKTAGLIDPELRYQRGTLITLKKNPENLTEKKRKRRDDYLKKHPAIDAVYQLKRELHQLFMNKHCNVKCKNPNLI